MDECKVPRLRLIAKQKYAFELLVATMRRRMDAYYTPKHAVRNLLAYHHIGGTILEPCVGEGHIIQALGGSFKVITNDMDPTKTADYNEDATSPSWWDSMPEVDWVITNPPFSEAPKIIPLAYGKANRGIAMLLRLSYLEPCKNRAAWLRKYPVSKLIVLPRISFTGDGKTDSVTCAWFIWDKYATNQRIIVG
jgi:hypothetical protein